MSRKLKVYYLRRLGANGFRQKPQISFAGDWLEQLGFAVGDSIRLQCENGKIVIIKE